MGIAELGIGHRELGIGNDILIFEYHKIRMALRHPYHVYFLQTLINPNDNG